VSALLVLVCRGETEIRVSQSVASTLDWIRAVDSAVSVCARDVVVRAYCARHAVNRRSSHRGVLRLVEIQVTATPLCVYVP
jgi:hypothetical protein